MSPPAARNTPELAALSAPQLHQLATLVGELAEAPGLPAALARLATGLAPLLPFDQAALALRAPDGRLWGVVCPREASGAEPGWLELQDPESPLLEALGRDRPVIRSAAAGELPKGFDPATPIHQLSLFPSALCLPLHGPDGPTGAIGLVAAIPNQYDASHLHLLAVAATVVEGLARRLLLTEELGRVDRDTQRLGRLVHEIEQQLTTEIRSPLAVLDNGLDFLRTSLLPSDAKQANEQVDELRLVAGTLVEMIDNLVELRALDTGVVEPRPAPVVLDTFLRERASARAVAARIGEVQLRVRCDPPDAAAMIDPRLLRRIIDNLLLNALRHTPRRGEVALVVAARPHLLTLAVADTGTPVPPDERNRMLERGPWGNSGRAPSRTFGLGYARAAVEFLGGQLAIEAPTGVGNLFRVTLPQ